MRQIEAELQGQLSLFRAEEAQITRLLTPFEEALILHEQADPKAEEYYLEAISEGDNLAEAYCNLALINLERGDASKALDQLTHSLKHDPRHVEAHYNLANLYYDHGDFPLARLHLSSDQISKRSHRLLQSRAGLSPPEQCERRGERGEISRVGAGRQRHVARRVARSAEMARPGIPSCNLFSS
jgi:tetratricopeptide (TPR) repeat protein